MQSPKDQDRRILPASAPAAAGFDTSQNEWFRPKEAAAHVKSSESTMAKQRLKGNGPTYTKFGRLVLYAKRDLDAYLISRRRRSTSEDPGGS